MIIKQINSKLNLVTAIAVTLFFSCKNNFKEVQKIGISQNEPVGVAKGINLKRTDSGRVVAHLISAKMVDFSNKSYPYTEFPDGIILHIYDDFNNKSTVISDYAISYPKTDLIDLQGNVILTSHKGDTLYADQLFYDQKKEWLFTNLPVKYKTGYDIIEGQSFDSDKNFKKTEVLGFSGDISVKQ
ncbi:LPS export ABC transporter periplasmic protein LptC [Lacinutrix salivirga]